MNVHDTRRPKAELAAEVIAGLYPAALNVPVLLAAGSVSFLGMFAAASTVSSHQPPASHTGGPVTAREVVAAGTSRQFGESAAARGRRWRP